MVQHALRWQSALRPGSPLPTPPPSAVKQSLNLQGHVIRIGSIRRDATSGSCSAGSTEMSAALPAFRVENLGPIATGTIQLRPLTILIGKNNSGKTYMAQAIYAAFKTLQRVNGPVEPALTPEESIDLVSELRDTSVAHTADLIHPFESKVQAWMSSRLERAGELLKNRLAVYFDVESLDELRRWGCSEPLEFAIAREASGDSPSTLFALSGDHERHPLSPKDISLGDLRATRTFDLIDDYLTELAEDGESTRDEQLSRRATSFLADLFWHRHLLPESGLGGAVHYLPAGRSGLLESWTDVVHMRLEQEREGLALSGREPAALGGIALDFLIELQRLTSPRRRHRSWALPRRPRHAGGRDFEAATNHLETLIGGSVVIGHGRERVPSLSYKHGKQIIPVQRASSMVAELAPLISWISELLSPGDLLLIDEPEAHMHPEAVLAVSEALVALSQAGVNVLCTTHSTEFLHQVSNCMLRASAKQPEGQGVGASISVEDLAVYRFDRRDRTVGTAIVPVEIDPDWGIPEDEYVAVADRLSEETSRLLSDTQ